MDGYCTICDETLCYHGRRHIFSKDGKVYSECLDCGEVVESPNHPMYAIAMYEGRIVDPDITEDWAGYEVCKKCYTEYTV